MSEMVFIRAKQVIGILLMLVTCQLSAQQGHSGHSAPAFSLPRLDNQQILSLAKLRGQVVYVDFWASWCPPCAESLPALQSLYEELQPQGFTVVAINLDETVLQAQRFVQPMTLTYPILFDANKQTPQQYGITGMPTAFLLDRHGNIHSRHTGFDPTRQPQLKQQIQQLLQETSWQESF